MKKFQLYNNVLGWITFMIAAIVYLLTMEPTTSLWDCGEFIASAYKLEVGHPPGAPLFMIMARFFSLFAGDAANTAKMVNAMSALASAATAMFLFWTITHLARKIVITDDDFSLSKLITILGSGLVGALAYTVSDTAWFSAVEGEVYASSSLFTALVFWAILKWENVAHERYSNRWLIFIAFLMGLSIGIHLLNLLAIPAIVFVYYFKKYKVTRKGIINALIVSLVLLIAIMYGVISGVVVVASWFELLFVNTFKLPFSSGVFFYAIALIALCSWGIYITRKKGKVILNTIITAFIVIVLGYSSFSMIVIRSLADPPMDENNPETVFSLLSYLNREQYGDRPLFKGQYYNAPVKEYTKGKPVWTKKDKQYVITDYKTIVKYDDRFVTFFPRMYSPSQEHIKIYNEWGKVKGTPISIPDTQGGGNKTIRKPTFGENLKFFFSYQFGYMYLRYFMWNFAGRQNDIQGHGGILLGNWMSGIPFFDKGRIGPQENLPAKYKNLKSQNNYYMLPLLLGLIGMLFHFSKHKKDAFVVGLLFILTGFAIVVYLNQTPIQPRERDYAYAGSFYAFTIWIGLGVLGIISAFKEKHRSVVITALVTLVCLALVPGIMARENWDDHDRSGRYTARDFAYNYLNSCAPNAILLTNGDNDTFPLWYLQEVEEVRTDVRVMNLMLLNTDWYIDQMRRKAYDSEPVPFSMDKDKYIQGKRDVVYFIPRTEDFVDLKRAVEFVANDDPRTKQVANYRDELAYFPTKNFILPVDSANVVNNGTVAPEMADEIVPEIRFTLNRGHVVKGEFMLLDLLANNNWERPIYFVAGGNSGALGLERYFQLEGLAYRLVPIQSPSRGFPDYGRINVDIMYDNLMNKFSWGRMEEPDVYLDHFNVRTLSVTLLRNRFARLANELSALARYDSAIAVLDRCMKLMPDEKVPFDYHITTVIDAYFNAGATGKATLLANQFSALLDEELDYFMGLKPKFRESIDLEIRIALQSYQELMIVLKEKAAPETSGSIEQKFMKYYTLYSQTQQQGMQ